MSETKEIKYRNDTGGTINIPELATGSQLEGAVKRWVSVEDGKTFEVDTIDGTPINPSLRILASAADHGIRPASEEAPKRDTGRKTRVVSR